MIYDQTMMALVYYFLPESVSIGEAELLVLSWWSLDCCYKE
jgi:cbb3-type cytochrome oxidase subunit 1